MKKLIYNKNENYRVNINVQKREYKCTRERDLGVINITNY